MNKVISLNSVDFDMFFSQDAICIYDGYSGYIPGEGCDDDIERGDLEEIEYTRPSFYQITSYVKVFNNFGFLYVSPQVVLSRESGTIFTIPGVIRGPVTIELHVITHDMVDHSEQTIIESDNNFIYNLTIPVETGPIEEYEELEFGCEELIDIELVEIEDEVCIYSLIYAGWIDIVGFASLTASEVSYSVGRNIGLILMKNNKKYTILADLYSENPNGPLRVFKNNQIYCLHVVTSNYPLNFLRIWKNGLKIVAVGEL